MVSPSSAPAGAGCISNVIPVADATGDFCRPSGPPALSQVRSKTEEERQCPHLRCNQMIEAQDDLRMIPDCPAFCLSNPAIATRSCTRANFPFSAPMVTYSKSAVSFNKGGFKPTQRHSNRLRVLVQKFKTAYQVCRRRKVIELGKLWHSRKSSFCLFERDRHEFDAAFNSSAALRVLPRPAHQTRGSAGSCKTPAQKDPLCRSRLEK